MLVAVLVLAAAAAAQEETALAAPADLYKDPEGVPLVSLPAGAPVEAGRARGGWHPAVVEGWIFTESTERTRRDGFDLVVTPDEGENLRSSPNGPVVGRVREGTLLERVGQKGRLDPGPPEGVDSEEGDRDVTRQGSAGEDRSGPGARDRTAADVAEAARTRGAASPAAPPAVDGGGERIQTARETPLAAAVEGGTLGTLQGGTPARVLARSGDLVKVQVEGWIPADAIAPSDSGAMVGVTAEEVARRPEPLRRPDGRVARPGDRDQGSGRAPERDAARPAVSSDPRTPARARVRLRDHSRVREAAEFESLPPLQELVLRVNIRAARTKFLTTPVAELVSVVSGMDGN